MKNNSFLILTITIVILLFNSCKEDGMDIINIENEQTTDEDNVVMIFKDETKFIDSETNDLMESATDNSLIFKKSNAILDSTKIGDVLVSTEETDFFENGYIFKVVDVTREGDVTTVLIVPGEITDYILYADIPLKWEIGSSSGKTSSDACFDNIEFSLDFLDFRNFFNEVEDEKKKFDCTSSKPFEFDAVLSGGISLSEVCLSMSSVIIIRPTDQSLNECIKAGIKNEYIIFEAFNNIIDCRNQSIEIYESRIEAFDLFFEIDAPQNIVDVEFGGKAKISMLWILSNLVPTNIVDKVSKYIKIKAEYFAYTNFEFKGVYSIKNEFGFNPVIHIDFNEIANSKIENNPVSGNWNVDDRDPGQIDSELTLNLIDMGFNLKIFNWNTCANFVTGLSGEFGNDCFNPKVIVEVESFIDLPLPEPFNANISLNKKFDLNPDCEIQPQEYSLVYDDFDNNTLGKDHGIEYLIKDERTVAKFSRENESRIVYDFEDFVNKNEGTIEMILYIENGYRYSDYELQKDLNQTLAFTTDIWGGDVTYPGSTWFRILDDGRMSLTMATAKYKEEPHESILAKNTDFKFNEWHHIGFSYGDQGQYLYLNGKIVAFNPKNKQILGAGGDHDRQLDKPTLGESVSGIWQSNRWEGGFNGYVDKFRTSDKQKDWRLEL